MSSLVSAEPMTTDESWTRPGKLKSYAERQKCDGVQARGAAYTQALTRGQPHVATAVSPALVPRSDTFSSHAHADHNFGFPDASYFPAYSVEPHHVVELGSLLRDRTQSRIAKSATGPRQPDNHPSPSPSSAHCPDGHMHNAGRCRRHAPA